MVASSSDSCVNLGQSAVMVCRDGASNDPRDQPGNGDVLGHVPLESHGDHGKSSQLPPLTLTPPL